MKKLAAFLAKYWMSILLCLGILYSCFMTTQTLPKIHVSNFDKLAHLLMFFAVSIVIFFDATFYFRKRIPVRKIIVFSFVFPIIYGGLIEIGQEYLSSYRTGDWIDFLSDGIGVSIAFIISLLINKRLAKRRDL